MKVAYEKPNMVVLNLSAVDVIRTSDTGDNKQPVLSLGETGPEALG